MTQSNHRPSVNAYFEPRYNINADNQLYLGIAGNSISFPNRAAAEVLTRFEVHALTDVTGFGLLGHLRNVTAASGVTAEVWADRVPVLDAAREYVKAGIAPGGTRANAKFLADWVQFAPNVSPEEHLLLCDAQTSGGLLAAVPGAVAGEVVKALTEAGTLASAVVGRITGEGAGKIRVV